MQSGSVRCSHPYAGVETKGRAVPDRDCVQDGRESEETAETE